MKKFGIIILLLGLLVSCNDKNRASSMDRQEVETSENVPPENIQKEREAVQTEVEPEAPVAVLKGRYRKLVKDKPAADCNCNCIEIDFDKPTEWCIEKDRMFITARVQRTGDNTANIYFVDVSRDDDREKKMPWADFDRDTPVASLEFHEDGSAKLDWKGFASGGEIATDYAILGKKTLEGTYKRDEE
ncbi:hypothetical protein [Salinimicrobium soli]|uniref:hypothetical protein n=1 Tax=Salinimicrobium soli TaxID=1254399 RepID=UPI003AAA8244